MLGRGVFDGNKEWGGGGHEGLGSWEEWHLHPDRGCFFFFFLWGLVWRPEVSVLQYAVYYCRNLLIKKYYVKAKCIISGQFLMMINTNVMFLLYLEYQRTFIKNF